MGITKELLAEKLNKCQYGNEMAGVDEAKLKELGLVIVFGYSDDNAEFRGAINDEVGAYDRTEINVCKNGIVVDWEQLDKDDETTVREWCREKDICKTITAFFDKDGYTFIYETDIPHATFEVMEDEDKYCRGIVFNIEDLL